MAKKVQLMTNAKEWQTVDGVEVLIDVPQEDLDPITDSSCVEIEGHRTLEETISQENMFTPEIVETKVHSKVGGVYHDNVVDGAYEEAILYGNTQVNLVESVTTGTKYIPHSFTSFQGNESKIGNYNSGRTNQVAPLVKGVTMVNLVQTTSVELAQGQSLCVENIKGNTEYTISFVFTQKNNSAGIVIQSYNGETYLENSKLQSNLGDEVVMTFITHENANKIYINNSVGYGGETIKLDNIMVIEGDVTDLDLPFFKGMRSVELSRPLTNLFTDDLVPERNGVVVTNSGDTITVESTGIYQWASARYYINLKPNTKYVIMWDSLTFTQTASGIDYIISVCEGDTIFSHMGNKFTTVRSIVFDTGNKSSIGIRIHATTSNSETGKTTVKGLRVFEWDDSLHTLDLQTIGYFSGTKYVSIRALETEGKNLYPYGNVSFTATNTNVDLWYDHKGTAYMHGDIALKSKSRFLLKQGTYTITTGVWVNATACQLIDDKEQIVVKLDSGQRNHIFTLSQDTYCTLRIKASVVNTVTQIPNIQIERGETATTYEAYQSRYYKPRETEEIILRSLPNGVCDTFNLQTGELVQNIGVAIYDGSDDELWGSDGIDSNNIPYFTITKSLPTIYTTHKLMYNCDIYKPCLDIDTDKIAITTTHHGLMLTANNYIRIKNGTTTREEFMASLKEKPVTLIYALKEPIITKLQTYDRIYNGQTNALVAMGNNLSSLTYYSNNYYLKVGNLSPVPGIIEPITTIPYDVRLKPSTLYTIKYSRGGNSNSMKFDLGGSVVEKTNATDLSAVAEELTVKTPAILSHEQLILSGTGYAHNFIVTEGDITGTELPYFEGMKDVKMPIVRNCGKNLFDGNFTIGGLSTKDGSYDATNKDWAVTDYIKVYNMQDITFNSSVSFSMNNFVYFKYDINKKFLGYIGIYNSYTTASISLDDNVHYIRFRVPSAIPSNSKFQLEEGIQATSYEPYRGNDVCLVQGEIGLSQDMFEQGGFSGSSGNTYDNCKANTNTNIRMRTKGLITVKPNTTYVVNNNTSPNMNHVFYLFDESQKYLGSNITVNAKSFVTPNNCGYVSLMFSKNNNVNITVSEFNPDQFQLLELDSTINLRSLPNGVKDELNLLTGEYIQRVGEVVLDGSEDEGWQLYDLGIGGSKYFRIGIPTMKSHGNIYTLCTHAICDKLENVPYYAGIYNMSSRPDSVVAFAFSNTLNAQAMFAYQTGNQGDLVQFKQWLQQSPITVQYELAEPIISHVRLVSNNQEREVGVKLPNGVSNTYNPSTGITTVRVGKVVLDGSENWDIYDQAPSNLDYFRLPVPTMFSTGNMNADKEIECKYIVSDTFPTVGYYAIQKANSTINYSVISGMYSSSLGVQCLYVYYKPSADLATFKAYLASNPITVWYELKYPQIQLDIVLPNGVHDEYNPETGVYTKKVGFVEFDGGEKNLNYRVHPNGYLLADMNNIKLSGLELEPTDNILSNISVNSVSNIYYNTDITTNCIALHHQSTSLMIKVMNISTVDEYKTYLSQNPIKVWYELATPITYQLTPYFGLPTPYAYEDGYLIHDSAYPETTLPPEFKYKLVANRTGQVMQNNRKLQEHTTRLGNLEALIIEATIESLFNRELQLFELELMDIQLIEL